MGELSAVESECVEAAAWYRRTFEWPCTAHGHAVWMLAGETVDAVDLPGSVGQEFLVGEQPVIEVPGEDICLRFLLAPAKSVPHRLVREVDRRGGVYHANASVIELPPTRVPGGTLRWLHGPHAPLPSLARLLRSEHKSSER